jgi:hypothetical protein
MSGLCYFVPASPCREPGRPDGLDEDRLRFYQLCMHLDLVAGPLRIADTSHPEREWFRSLAEHHLQRALRFPAWRPRSSAETPDFRRRPVSHGRRAEAPGKLNRKFLNNGIDARPARHTK